ncbi:MAG TPA: Holliday junction resolvase RuvX [Candidatus Obscuribacterales bacterium]
MISAINPCSQPVILGFDPGRQKCGLAVMGLDRVLLHRAVVAAAEVLTAIAQLQAQYPISLIVMGDQTSAADWQQTLTQLQQLPRVVLVDERYSSLEARDRYWQLYPPQGLQRLLPQGLRQPPGPIDDIVAMLLIERYLNRLTEK